MKKIVWVLAVLVLFSCRRKEKANQPEENPDLVVQSNITEEQKDFADAFKAFLMAFKAEELDYEILNQFIKPDGEVYAVYSSEGMYSDYLPFDNMEELVKEEKVADAITYFRQSANDARVVDGEIQYEELDNVDPCTIDEVGYYGDYGNTGILSETYKLSQENLGEDPKEEEMKKIKAFEDAIKMKVYVGIGDEADVFYFTNDNGKWYVSIMDFSECGI